jgi:hypothetical protein
VTALDRRDVRTFSSGPIVRVHSPTRDGGWVDDYACDHGKPEREREREMGRESLLVSFLELVIESCGWLAGWLAGRDDSGLRGTPRNNCPMSELVAARQSFAACVLLFWVLPSEPWWLNLSMRQTEGPGAA